MKARTQEAFAKKWTGCVEIKTGDNVAKLTSIQTTGKDGAVKKFPGDVDSIKIKLDEFPKVARKVIKPNMDTKKFRVRLDEDGTTVETVTPYSGVYRGRLIELVPKTGDGEFKLIHKVFNEGKENENRHEEFIAAYVIVDGVYREVELPGFYLHYKFEEDPENEGFTRFNTVNTPQASQLHKLIAWAEVHGDILEDDVRWHSEEDGTILGELEDRALENDREVNLVFEKGYIKSVQPVEDYEEDENAGDGYEELPDFLKESEKVVEDEDVEPVEIKSKSQAKRVAIQKSAKAPARKKAAVAEDDDL